MSNQEYVVTFFSRNGSDHTLLNTRYTRDDIIRRCKETGWRAINASYGHPLCDEHGKWIDWHGDPDGFRDWR